MSMIVPSVSHMINRVVDSLRYARGRPTGGGRRRKWHKRLQIPSHIYYPIKLPSLPPPTHHLSCKYECQPRCQALRLKKKQKKTLLLCHKMNGKLLNGLWCVNFLPDQMPYSSGLRDVNEVMCLFLNAHGRGTELPPSRSCLWWFCGGGGNVQSTHKSLQRMGADQREDLRP